MEEKEKKKLNEGNSLLKTDSLKVNLELLSIGCNPGSASWGRSNLVAYGAHYYVILYSPSQFKSISSLVGHSARVNCVSWIPNIFIETQFRWETSEEELISGSSDGCCISWMKDESGVTLCKK